MKIIKTKLFLLFFVMILLVGTVNAVAPITQLNIQQETPALTIVYPKILLYEKEIPISVPFDVLNSSFFRLKNDNTSCEYFVVNDVGSSVANGNLTYSDTLNYWFFNLTGSDISEAGFYNFYVHCNSSVSEAGFVSLNFEVTNTGTETTTALSLIYIISIMVSILLLFLCLFFAWSIDGENKFEFGKILEVNLNKYLKMGLAFLSYLFLIITMFFAWQITDKFLELTFVTSLFKTIFMALWYLLLPFMLGFMAIIIVKAVADFGLHNMKVRGLKGR